MAFFRVKVGDQVYELDRLTLGDGRVLKQKFGLEDLTKISPGDPDMLVGLLFLALKRAKPDAPDANLIAEIEDIDIDGFTDLADDEDDDAGPPAEAGAASPAPSE